MNQLLLFHKQLAADIKSEFMEIKIIWDTWSTHYRLLAGGMTGVKSQ